MATIEKIVVELEAGTDLAKAMQSLVERLDVVEGALEAQVPGEAAREAIISHGSAIRYVENCVEALQIQIADAARCIKGQAEELTKTNKRMDALVADREKHQRRLDDRLEEVIESTQEAEKAFLIRIERAEKKRDAAYGEIAKLKRAAKGDQD